MPLFRPFLIGMLIAIVRTRRGQPTNQGGGVGNDILLRQTPCAPLFIAFIQGGGC